MNTRFFVVLLLAVIVYSANIWGLSVYILDESKNAGCAMAMYQNDEWIVPTFNNELRTDKPVLHYYFMKAGFGLFGINPLGARVFSSIMGVLTVLSVFFFTKRIVDERTAFYASLILLSSIQLAVQFHMAVPDPYLLFFFTIGWLSFFYGWRSEKKYFIYLFYVSISLAFLTKGPVALIFSALIVFIFLITEHRFTIKTLMSIRILEGALIFCLVGLPWYILVGISTNGEWLDQFFFKHNVGRFTDTMEGHGGFPLASFVILIGGLMPFSFFLPQAFKMVWKEWRNDSFIRFCSVAALVVVIFFAFSRTILPTYPEPAFAFTAILLGILFRRLCENQTLQYNWISGAFYLLVALILPVGIFLALKQDPSLSELSSLAFGFIVLPVGAVVGLIHIVKGKIQSALQAYAGSVILFLLIFFYILFPKIDSQNPVTQSLSQIADNSKTIACYKDFNPAYVFALKHSVIQLNTIEDLNAFHKKYSEFYLITEKKYLNELSTFGFTNVYEGKNLFEDPVTVVLETNRN